jgi:hypothetical protein
MLEVVLSSVDDESGEAAEMPGPGRAWLVASSDIAGMGHPLSKIVLSCARVRELAGREQISA